MARIVWRNNDLDRMASQVRAIPEQFLNAAAEIIEDSAQDGAAQMRNYIETRGTGYDGHAGRVDEGYMLGDVAASEVENTGRSASAQYGWGVTGGPVQDYYRYQENGFKHWRSGKSIPPMHALLDSFVETREKFFSRIARLVK